MKESAQEFTQNDVSRLRELAVVKSMCPSVCKSFLCMLDITHRMSLAASTVNSTNCGHFGMTAFVLYLDSVLYWGVL